MGNGWGNSLGHYTCAMSACVLSNRSCFSSRNIKDCGNNCQVDVAAYYGADGGVEWRWSSALETRLVSFGVHETVLDFDSSSWGFVEHATGLRVPGAPDLLTLLAHEAVARAPWVRLRLPLPTAIAALDSLWHAAGLNGYWGFISSRNASSSVTAAAGADAAGGCSPEAAARCVHALFLRPLPTFQAVLAPHLARLDAAGNASVYIHVRTGYADHAAGGGPVSFLEPEGDGARDGAAPPSSPPPQPSAVGAAENATGFQEAHARLWTLLDRQYAPCDTLRAPPPPPPPPSPPLPSPPHHQQPPAPLRPRCVQWDDGAVSAATTRGARCAESWGGTPTLWPPSSAPPPQPLVFGSDPTSGGVISGMLACAASRAAAVAAADAAAAAAAAAGEGARHRPAPAPWVVYVAGDMPPLVMLAAASPSLNGLSGHVLSATGAFGHVSFSAVCRVPAASLAHAAPVRVCHAQGVDPGGAWTRSFTDLHMMGSAASVLLAGGSSFLGAASARVFWEQPVERWSFHVQPSGADRAFRAHLNVLLDAVTHKLESSASKPLDLSAE